jgi:hypothetical protein
MQRYAFSHRGIHLKTAIILLVIVLLVAAPLPAYAAAGPSLALDKGANAGYTMGCPGCPGCPDNPVRDPNAPACY